MWNGEEKRGADTAPGPHPSVTSEHSFKASFSPNIMLSSPAAKSLLLLPSSSHKGTPSDSVSCLYTKPSSPPPTGPCTCLLACLPPAPQELLWHLCCLLGATSPLLAPLLLLTTHRPTPVCEALKLANKPKILWENLLIFLESCGGADCKFSTF